MTSANFGSPRSRRSRRLIRHGILAPFEERGFQVQSQYAMKMAVFQFISLCRRGKPSHCPVVDSKTCFAGTKLGDDC
jgi:hypothetical protein